MNVAGVPLPERLDPYSVLTPTFIGLVDTDALLSSVRNDCEHGPGWRSRMLRMTDHQTSFLYAADHVYLEAYERFPKLAKSSTVPLEDLLGRFEEAYLPVIRFVTLSPDQPYDEQVASVVDPKDVPTAQLAKLVPPYIVFSGDKHLRKPGFAPKNWRAVAKAGVEVAEANLKSAVTANSIVLPAQGVGKTVQIVANKVGVSPWLLASLAAGAAAVYLRHEAKRAAVKEFVGAVGAVVLTQLAEALEQEHRGKNGLRPALLAASPNASIKQQVAILLARQGEPLLAKEIHYRVVVHFRAEPAPTVAQVRAVLQENAEFVRSGRYRWQFGRECEPLNRTNA